MGDVLGLLVVIFLSRVVVFYSRKLILIKNLSHNDTKDFKKLVATYYISIFSIIGIILLYILGLLLSHSVIKPGYLVNDLDIALGMFISVAVLLISSYLIRKRSKLEKIEEDNEDTK